MSAAFFAGGLILATSYILFGDELRQRRKLIHEVSTTPPDISIPILTELIDEELRDKFEKKMDLIFRKGGLRIIVPSGSAGTDADAHIYQTILPGSKVCYVDPHRVETHPDCGSRAYINLYIEKIVGSREDFPSDKSWMMINQEMLPLEKLDQIKVVLCKTKYAEKLARRNRGLFANGSKIIYTAHTSTDLMAGKAQKHKDHNLAVHFAGKSWLKNTGQVIDAWIKAKQDGSLRPNDRLVVTCRDMCLRSNTLKQTLFGELTQTENGHISKKYSIVVYEFIPADELSILQRSAAVFICPSSVEGYGHYINEGRSAGAAIVTVNFPPMNELVDDANGFLVPISGTSREGSFPGSLKCTINTDDLARTISKAMKSIKPDKMMDAARRASRSYYERDTRFLRKTLINLVCD